MIVRVLLLVVSCASVVACGTRAATSTRSADPVVVCFFGGGTWRYERMTHFIPGFLGFNGDGELDEWDLRPISAAAHRSGVKVIVSFDGEHWQDNFLPMSDNDDGSRDHFVENILQFCLDNDVDGVDYDWEIGGGFSPAQQSLYSELVVETKRAFKPHGLSVSIDAYFRDELNAEGIAAVDWLQLMAYEDMAEMRSMVEYWEARGVPRSKIVIGMAAGWGDEGEGMDRSLARSKVRYCIDGGYAGLMLFRTDLDSEDAHSMLNTVHTTLQRDAP